MEHQAKAQQALNLVNVGRYKEAVPLLKQLLKLTYIVDFEYDDWLRALADSFQMLGQHVQAGYIYLYLHYFDNAHDCFSKASDKLDLALCEEVRGNHQRAARLYQSEGRYVRAAINLERTGDWNKAVEAWRTARSDIRPETDAYPHALATVNLALAQREIGEVNPARDLFVQAIMIIEGHADEWENMGFLDEALGAYHALCLIGKTEQRFENLAEGYCNAIRLLKEQGQTYRVFRYYAALTGFGENLGEDHAVATLHREAADFAVRTGTLYQNFYLQQAAQAYIRVAGRTREQSNFPELAENAYLAAIDAYNQMGDLRSVDRCYRALSTLELDPDKTERYARLADETRTMEAGEVQIYEPSRLLLNPPDLPPVWRDELLEWEAGDDPKSVLSSIVWDLEYGDVARRMALNLILYQLDLRSDRKGDDPTLQKQIASTMGGLRYTIAYKTLRQLVDSKHAEVRAEVMTAASRMAHPKAFILLELGLLDKEDEVRQSALSAITAHTYPEAYDHLVRLYQQNSDVNVRITVLRTLGQIKSFEAAEYLWSVLRSDAVDEQERQTQEAASAALQSNLTPEWRSIFRSRLHTEPEEIRERLRSLLG